MSAPEIITVNSEALEAQIRELLPSQNGFGSELQASNVIMPIIDLTAAAEGSGLSTSLQQAIAFGSQTAFETKNTTTNIATSGGFYRVLGCATIINSVSAVNGAGFTMTDGSSTKQVWACVDAGGSAVTSVDFDLIFFLPAGITLTAFSDVAGSVIAGSIRQVATSTGLLVNPNGFVDE